MKMRGKSTDIANAGQKADYIHSRIVTITTLEKSVKFVLKSLGFKVCLFGEEDMVRSSVCVE